jgi:hypothetical protein
MAETKLGEGETPHSAGRWAFLIGAGIFATTLAQSSDLALPLRNMLTEELKEPLRAISLFFAIVAVPWYFKIVVGLLSDSIPLFGTRRRHYLLVSATLAGALWLSAGYISRSYLALLATFFAMEAMLVVGSTIVGGLLVEAGQRLGAAGRLVAARIFVETTCTIIAGPVAGALAGVPFSMAAAVGGLIAFSMAPIVFILLKEPTTATYEVSAIADVYHELRGILGSRALWEAAVFLLIAAVPQAFPTVLWDFQKHVLKFDDMTIGYLLAAEGAGGVLASIVYGWVYPRLRLRYLLAMGILCSAFGSIGYLFYRSVPTAIAIDTANGFLTTLWVLAMMETAVWVTPRRAAAAGFALLMSAVNIGAAIGDVLASSLVDWRVVSFAGIAVLYSGATVVILAIVPLLPGAFFTRRGG